MPDAVTRLTERVAAELGVPADVQVDGPPRPLPPGAEVVLLRATQEALANVRKHAAPRTVRVRLAYDDDCTTLEVADDGRGFAVGAAGRLDSYGLVGMRERADAIGAALEIDTAPGRGTIIRCCLEQPNHEGTSR